MSAPRGFYIVLACALLILLINGIVSLVDTDRMVGYQNDVVRTDAVLTGLQRVLIAIDDAETGQRGFVITGQQSYLTPYRRARAVVASRLQRVAALTAGDATQQQRLKGLRQLISAKFAELARTIALRARGHNAAAVSLVRSNQGQRYMQGIRTDISVTEAEQRALLKSQTVSADQSNRQATITVVIATIANIVLVGFIFYLANRWLRRRDQLLRGERAARMEQEQVAAEQAAILGQIVDGVVVTDSRGTITFVNHAARQLFGAPLVGATIEEVVAQLHLADKEGGQVDAETVPMGRALFGGESVPNDEIHVVHGDGREVVLQVSAAPVTGPHGARLGSVGVFRDVTAQRALEQDKANFLSSAAHDLKTPLATIKGVSQLLLRRAHRTRHVGVEGLSEGLERIDITATRMNGLITEMLDITRLEMGRPVDLVRQPFNLVEMVRERVREAQRGHPKHPIRVETEDDDLRGTWDEARLERVLDNLLSNAIKFSPGGGDVFVRLRCEERGGAPWAVLSVSDTGVGIPATEIDHIFERFRRGSNVAGVIPGTGVGLAAAAQLIEQHGGTIAIASEEGHGTTVTVALPIDLRAPGSQPPADQGAADAIDLSNAAPAP